MSRRGVLPPPLPGPGGPTTLRPGGVQTDPGGGQDPPKVFFLAVCAEIFGNFDNLLPKKCLRWYFRPIWRGEFLADAFHQARDQSPGPPPSWGADLQSRGPRSLPPPPGSRPTSLLSSLSNPVRPVSRIPDFFLRTRCTIAPAPPISKPPLLWGPAAIIIAALPPLLNYKEFLFLWRVNKFDCLVFSAAFLGTVFLGVELGLAISIGVPWGLSEGGV